MSLLIPNLNELKVDLKYIGIPYVAGGMSFSGTDCAGLVCLFLKDHNISLPYEDSQLSIKDFIHKGRLVKDQSELQPLDILIFKYNDIFHAGVYTGYGKFLQQNVNTTSGIVRLSSIWGSYFYYAIRPTELFYDNEELYNEIKDKRIEFIISSIAATVATIVSGIALSAGLVALSSFAYGAIYALAFVATSFALYTGLSYGISALMSATQKSPKPSFGSGGIAEGSPRYGFGSLQNTATSDLPVPVLYGELKLAGNAIYQSEPGETVYRCDTLCEGEVNSFTDIRINDISIAEISGCSVTTYTGTSSQNVDSRFSNRVYGLRNLAYLALTLQTSEKLKGGFPVITCLVQGTKVETWDGLRWTSVKTYSNNPTACIRDFILNSRYGIGLSSSLLDDSSFGEAYDYCEILVSNNQSGTEKRYTLDYVIDSKKPAIDILGELLSVCGGFLVWSGNRLKMHVEKIENVVQNFTMSNIIEGSFSYQYTPKDTMVNRVRLLFIDPTQNYTKVYALAEDKINQDDVANIDGGNGIIEKELALLGVTKFSRASRLANMFLKNIKATPMTCKFKVGIFALHCEPGDVITISHDVPAWVNKSFRIFSIEEESNDEIALICKEYNDSVYDDSYGSGIALYSYGSPPQPWAPPQNPSNVVITETGFISKSGVFVTVLDINFNVPSVTDFIQYYFVEYSKDGGSYLSLGTTTGTSIQLGNADEGSTYIAKVKSVNYYGISSSGVTSNSYIVLGKSTAPEDVSGFSVVLSIDAFLFSWTAVSDVDLKGYEIRVGNSWSTASVVATDITGISYIYRPVTAGTKIFRIKSVDTSGNYSDTEDIDTITVTRAPDSNVVITDYLWSALSDIDNISGTLTGEWSLEYTNKYDSSYNRRTFCLRTNQTFGEMQTTGNTYLQFQNVPTIIGQPLISSTNAIYTTASVDLGAPYSGLTTLITQSENDAVATFTKEISTSLDGITWSAFATHSAASYYNLRFYKLRLTFQTSSLTTNFFFKDAIFEIDVPDVFATDGGNGVDIAIGGTIVTFSAPFSVPPRSLVVSTINATANITAIITNQTATGFTCTLYDNTDTSVSGNINYWAKGW